jgi:hypothetical protein
MSTKTPTGDAELAIPTRGLTLARLADLAGIGRAQVGRMAKLGLIATGPDRMNPRGRVVPPEDCRRVLRAVRAGQALGFVPLPALLHPTVRVERDCVVFALPLSDHETAA